MSAGERITPDDLKTYKLLQEEDSEFEFATILTSGNRERQDFNTVQSMRWAVQNKTHVIRWHRRIRDNTWKGKPKEFDNVKRAQKESCFWELFVPGAPAYITVNLSIEKRIANGLPVEYHSISFLDKNFEFEVFETIRCCEHGSVITIEHPPDFINVELFPDIHGDYKATAVNVLRRLNWKGGSITNDGRIVVPISMTPKHQLKYRACSIRGGGGHHFRPSTVQLADFFPIEPGFSITVHKAQVSS